MTSLAFGLGVLPLAVATGAGAGAQRAIGTGVFGGMLAGTFLGIFFIPLFFVVVQRLFHSVPDEPVHDASRQRSAACPRRARAASPCSVKRRSSAALLWACWRPAPSSRVTGSRHCRCRTSGRFRPPRAQRLPRPASRPRRLPPSRRPQRRQRATSAGGTSSSMRACSRSSRGARQQPRSARGRAQYRAGARAIPHPARRRCSRHRRQRQLDPREAAAGADLRQRRPSPSNIIQAGVGITQYEMDLFGRVRSLTHAALQQYLAQEEARRSAQLS